MVSSLHVEVVTIGTDRASTGVQGLDGMLGGGFPPGSIVLVCGGPGAGKTILSLQYTAAAVGRGEPCVYVSLEEAMEKKKRYAEAFGWDLDSALKDGLLSVLDYQFVPRGGSTTELVERTSREIEFSVEQQIAEAALRVRAKHIVVDPLTSILIHESSSGKKRHLVYQLFEATRGLGCTALITSEGIPSDDAFYSEHFLSDGVIIMQKDLLSFRAVKTVRIDKMRGIDYDEQPRRYAVTGKGLRVFNTEPVLL